MILYGCGAAAPERLPAREVDAGAAGSFLTAP